MAKDVPEMIRGLGMGMALLRGLNESVIKHGGCPEMLHYLTTERGRANLEELGKAVASMSWRVPKSLVMSMANEESSGDTGAHIQADEMFYWQPALRKLGIPFISFAWGESMEKGDVPIPLEIRNQLIGKLITPGMPISYDGERYVLITFNERDGIDFSEPLREQDLTAVEIALERYFDLDN